jgi:AAA15 family ATPase/GTPase
MNNHFIKNIEIKNFKCFEDFNAEGFGRVNLIGGKNNVGKTAFMEAFFIASNSIVMIDSLDDIIPFLTIESLRGIVNIYDEMQILEIVKIFDKYENVNISSNNSKISLTIEKKDLVEKFLINDKNPGLTREMGKYLISNKRKLYNFIPSYMIGNVLIIDIFDKIKRARKREELNHAINLFDKNILEFDIIENIPNVFLNNLKKFHDIVELGHGLKRYIAIISAILINKDGFLFLDEIENGIHYTQLDELWKIILEVSKEQNVQVFATTHSKECIESYARVAKKLEDEEVTFIELGRNKNNKLASIVYDFEAFLNEVEQRQEIRGW